MVGKNQAQDAPHTPGVYFFEDGAGKIIYIGKAQNLRMRLLSYFRRDELDARKRTMLKEAESISWRELSSDTEALIQESSLIKRHHPKYNVSMRDDKQHFYIAFTKGEFPKIFVTHQPQMIRHPMSDHLGPFTDGWAVKSILKSLRRSFPYCQCSVGGAQTTPKFLLRKNLGGREHSRPCQQTSIGRCLGVCCLKEKEWPKFYTDYAERVKKYRENIKIIKKIFSGKYKAVINRAKKQMESASANMDYEHAAEFRNELKALENIFEHRLFLSRDDESWKEKAFGYLKTTLGLKNTKRIEIFDISNLQGKLAVGAMVVFTDGIADKNEYRKFKIRMPEKPNDVAMIKETVSRRLKHDDWPTPNLMIIDGGKAQLGAALSAKYGSGKDIPMTALAKREEELYLPDGRIIKLKEGPEPMLHLITSMRDEAHRFAISYHKKLRSKQITQT